MLLLGLLQLGICRTNITLKQGFSGGGGREAPSFSLLNVSSSIPPQPKRFHPHTNPLVCCSVRQGKAFLIRPPEGMCGIGNHRSPVWPAKVSCNTDGRSVSSLNRHTTAPCTTSLHAHRMASIVGH